MRTCRKQIRANSPIYGILYEIRMKIIYDATDDLFFKDDIWKCS